MKKVLSIVVLACLFVLVGCTTNTKSNARAYVTSIAAKSTSVSFKVEVRDPDSELDSNDFVVRLSATGTSDVEQALALTTQNRTKTMTFEDLVEDTEYAVYVIGKINSKDVELYASQKVFKTLKQGDEAENPIMIETTEQFLNMDAKKHYALANDLDFENASFGPLFKAGTPFNGSFDGREFTIRNINITEADDVYQSYASIFGYASRSTIKNVKFDNIHIDNDEKPYIGISHVGFVVAKVSNNGFLLENVEITNSSITIRHNINQSLTNRNLYVGLVGGSMQGTLRNIVVKNSNLNVTQHAVNGTYAGSQAATAGTYVGGAFGLIEQDKGTGIENIAVVDTKIDVTIDQDKAALGSGLLFVGGVFGAYRSDRNAQSLYSNATITLNHKQHENTASDKLDTVYVGGLVGSMIKSRFNEAYGHATITLTLSNPLNRVHAHLLAGQATSSSMVLLAGGSIDVVTTNDTQYPMTLEVFPHNWSNKLNQVKILADASITFDGVAMDLSNFTVVDQVEDHIHSAFVLEHKK